MARCRVEQDELDHDMQLGMFKPFVEDEREYIKEETDMFEGNTIDLSSFLPSAPVKSIFDCADDPIEDEGKDYKTSGVVCINGKEKQKNFVTGEIK